MISQDDVTPDYNPDVRRFRSLEELNTSAADLIVTVAGESIQEHGIFTLVLAGGGTPKSLYELLAADLFTGRLDWQRTHLFWGDERCVPPEHMDSNYNMSYASLLSRIDLPRGNIHRIQGENGSPEVAAQNYENDILSFMNETTNVPSFDIILLGMGPDGHTASLFPGDSVLTEKDRLVAPVTAPSYMSPAHRVTMTLPLINRAANVMFLVAGAEKKALTDRILMAPDAKPPVPAALVRPEAGNLFWFIADR